MTVTVSAPAKINWLLRVLGKRDDGYHDLETIFQTVSLHDTLALTEADSLTLTSDDRSMPLDGRNLVVRAARAMIERHGAGPVRIHLEKRIPTGGGLGGGSSDAAATMLAMRRMFHLAIPPHELFATALSLGSDVPFFLIGGTAYATGRGEKLIPLPDQDGVPLLLVFPGRSSSTPSAFASLASARKRGELAVSTPTVEHPRALRGSIREWVLPLVNDFEAVIVPQLPQLDRYKGLLLRHGAWWAGMTGSGSTMDGAFADGGSRDAAAAAFEGQAATAPVMTTAELPLQGD